MGSNSGLVGQFVQAVDVEGHERSGEELEEREARRDEAVNTRRKASGKGRVRLRSTTKKEEYETHVSHPRNAHYKTKVIIFLVQQGRCSIEQIEAPTTLIEVNLSLVNR